jgi:hypothetical protein
MSAKTLVRRSRSAAQNEQSVKPPTRTQRAGDRVATRFQRQLTRGPKCCGCAQRRARSHAARDCRPLRDGCSSAAQRAAPHSEGQRSAQPRRQRYSPRGPTPADGASMRAGGVADRATGAGGGGQSHTGAHAACTLTPMKSCGAGEALATGLLVRVKKATHFWRDLVTGGPCTRCFRQSTLAARRPWVMRSLTTESVHQPAARGKGAGTSR